MQIGGILFQSFTQFYVAVYIFKIKTIMSANNSHYNSNVVKFKTLDATIQNMLREAVEARTFSYSPYSKFKVGAALLCDDGSVYRGCNVESVAFTVGVCAERTAYVKAISEGKLKFKAIAIIGYHENSYTFPCGACRQLISEFGNVDIFISKPGLDDVFVTSLNVLLPHQFEL